VPAYWVISLTVYLLLFYYFIRDTERIFDEAEYISDELGKIKGVLRFLEKYQYKKGSKLLEMCRPFITDKERPSFLINKMKNTVELLRMREANPFVWNMMRMIFPVDIYFRLRLKKQKSLIEDKFDTWMNIWYKLESLCSLANFAYLNPEYTFPRIVNNEVNKIVFCGRQLGHPLISNKNKVCNDFSFNPDGEVALITGSNMSGKSTFIRTLGVNISLAYAGSVVNADYLEVSLFDLFSCIKVNDSLQESISFFYAEVKRLKALLDEIDKSQYPVLFLIDEIFRGTNNIERFKGSSMYIKKLVGTNAVGAVATHDLELVKLSGESVKVNIYHFKEEIINGEMVFDYKINPGPCPTTNALKIMKLAGLPVEEC
jgi:DNA mismatch repair ATPase MutS